MVLFETRGLWLSWIVRGGIECPGRLACFNARIGLTASVDTSPRIRASQEPDGHNQEWFQGGNGLFARDAQAACCFKCLASKLTSFFQTINAIAAIFRANVRRAIDGFLPLVSKAS
jgi:hypothetical protein